MAQQKPSRDSDLRTASHRKQPAAALPADVRIADPAALAAGPDVFGGYSSNRIIIQYRPGVVIASDKNFATLRLADQPDAPAVNFAINAAHNQIDAAIRKWRVQSIDPLPKVAPANKALAQQIGLDRYCAFAVPHGTDTAAMAAEFSAMTDLIDSAQVDGVGGIAGTFIPNDSNFAQQWNMHNTGQAGTPNADVNAPEAWAIHQGASNVVVAVLDTGVMNTHPDMFGRVTLGPPTYLCAPPPPPPNPNPCPSYDSFDIHGHGTHCAGTIMANGNNGQGIAGLNWNCQLLAVRVLHPTSGVGDEVHAANGVIWVTDNGAHIISMSLQYSAGTDYFRDAVAYAWDSGVLPIAATGNFTVGVQYPAKFPKCMGVGATTNTDLKWSGSATGPEVDVVAPGHQVYSACANTTYCGGGLYGPVSGLSGTSMAVPHVSGIASLIRSYNPALSISQIEQIIKSTAKDLGAVGWDNQFGWGRVDAKAALLAAAPVFRPADLNNDGVVNVDDLVELLAAWGPCPGSPCLADIAPSGGGDGLVNVDDLVALLADWG